MTESYFLHSFYRPIKTVSILPKASVPTRQIGRYTKKSGLLKNLDPRVGTRAGRTGSEKNTKFAPVDLLERMFPSDVFHSRTVFPPYSLSFCRAVFYRIPLAICSVAARHETKS